jgi:hypothetical protein
MRETHEKEGVVKYTVKHETARITFPPDMPDLMSWRQRLRALELIGADSDGLGYGNLSIRLYGSPSFLITGSQSSGLGEVDQRHFARVTVVDLDKNFLRSADMVSIRMGYDHRIQGGHTLPTYKLQQT